MSKNVNKVLSLINSSPCAFFAIDTIRKELDSNGFTYLKENSTWDIKEGGSFYTVRNNSSLIAFTLPKEIKDYHFQLVSAHTDSPTYKVKSESELIGPGEFLRLNVEGYGGMIDYTWFDKPLTVAGRVLVKDGNKVVSKLLYIDKDLLIIPSLPIHFNRDVNNGYKFNKQIDLCPLFSCGELKKGDFDNVIAKELGCDSSDILSKELSLVNRQEGKIWGYENEFISSGRLDDLEAIFTALLGFISSKDSGHINVFCAFDNEEVGSNTKQGAASTFLKDSLKRINFELRKTHQELFQALSKSFMVSFDNAHSLHPNHPEKYDPENRCYMNKGIVIKENVSQKYTTDAFSRALFKEILNIANVPYQSFANRSDQMGGSTLGNISNTEVSMHAVDIGLAQLAMHSSYETAGVKDIDYAIKGIKEFYNREIKIDEADGFEII